MKPALWRAIALLCIAAALAFVGYELTLPDSDGFGLQFFSTIRSGAIVQVSAVDPNSPASRAGIRPGDTIDIGSSILARARVVYPTPGTRVHVIVNGTRRVTMTAVPSARVQIPWGSTAVRLAFLLIAAMLAWRRPDDRAVRSLVAFLFCYGTAIAMANGVLPTPLLSLLVMNLGTGALLLFGTAWAASFGAEFPSGCAQPLPRALARIGFAVATVAVVIVVAADCAIDSPSATATASQLFFSAFVLLVLLLGATLVLAYVHGEPAARQRRRWVFFLLAVGLAGPLADVLVGAATGYNAIVDQLTLLTLAALPIGLAYVILRHRVIDVGFVLNRALVYTGVSLVIVGAFVIVETLLARYVENASHVTSIAVQLAVALALGFSIRYVHARVDRAVDRVLFRERHLAEAAIRTFAQEASYVTNLDVLLARCVKTVERYAKARAAGVWLAAGPGLYRAQANSFAAAPDVDENDPAAVSMRARHVSVHVRECASALPGVLAFPMIVRGELLGILVCGQKVDDETYDPDEEAALASLAASVGHAVDAIEVRELRRRLQALTATRGNEPAF